MSETLLPIFGAGVLGKSVPPSVTPSVLSEAYAIREPWPWGKEAHMESLRLAAADEARYWASAGDNEKTAFLAGLTFAAHICGHCVSVGDDPPTRACSVIEAVAEAVEQGRDPGEVVACT